MDLTITEKKTLFDANFSVGLSLVTKRAYGPSIEGYVVTMSSDDVEGSLDINFDIDRGDGDDDECRDPELVEYDYRIRMRNGFVTMHRRRVLQSGKDMFETLSIRRYMSDHETTGKPFWTDASVGQAVLGYDRDGVEVVPYRVQFGPLFPLTLGCLT